MNTERIKRNPRAFGRWGQQPFCRLQFGGSLIPPLNVTNPIMHRLFDSKHMGVFWRSAYHRTVLSLSLSLVLMVLILALK